MVIHGQNITAFPILLALKINDIPIQSYLSGLYIGAHGIYSSEVIHLRRKFGQWREDGQTKDRKELEFYEYVEALKLTGDRYVPAGKVVTFHVKIVY